MFLPEAQEYAITGSDVKADDSDNVIQLTGDDDDEVDVGMLMAKLGLLNSQEGKWYFRNVLENLKQILLGILWKTTSFYIVDSRYLDFDYLE